MPAHVACREQLHGLEDASGGSPEPIGTAHIKPGKQARGEGGTKPATLTRLLLKEEELSFEKLLISAL